MANPRLQPFLPPRLPWAPSAYWLPGLAPAAHASSLSLHKPPLPLLVQFPQPFL